MARKGQDGNLRAVTLRDVARRAGVDVSTASRALTGRRRVTAQLSDRVEQAAEALGYSPNQAARSLRLARTMTLGIVFSQFRNPGLMEFLEGLDSGAAERGYSLMVTVARGDVEHYRTLVRRLLERRVDGLFVTSPPELEDVLRLSTRAGTQIVALFARSVGGEGLPLITANEYDAILAAVQRLAALGHRRVCYLGSAQSIPSVRSDWLARASQATFVTLDAEVVPDDDEPAAVVDRVQQVLRGPQHPTALFIEYSMAPRLLHALAALHIRVPEDLSLVVFGESMWTLEPGPALASIRHDMRAMGAISATALVDRLEGQPAPAILDTGVAEWVERGSVGPASQTE